MLLQYPSFSRSVKPRNIYKITPSTSEKQKVLLIVSSVDAVPVHIGEQVRRQVNDIFSADNLPPHDHTKRFPICHTSYTPKNTITRLTHLLLRAATGIGFLPFFRLKSLKYKIVDCVHIRKMCLHQHSARWLSLKPWMHCELWPQKCSVCLYPLSVTETDTLEL